MAAVPVVDAAVLVLHVREPRVVVGVDVGQVHLTEVKNQVELYSAAQFYQTIRLTTRRVTNHSLRREANKRDVGTH